VSDCPACGKEYRNGVHVMLLNPAIGHNATVRRVCKKCAKTGMITVAAQVPAQIVTKVADDGFAERCIRQLRVLAGAAGAAAEAETRDESTCEHHLGCKEGFEGAIELLKRESRKTP